MFFNYNYFNHPFGRLHSAVKRFLWRLRRSDRARSRGGIPGTFRVADWCDGVLLKRANNNAKLLRLMEDFYQAYGNLTRGQRRKLYNSFRIMNRVEMQLTGKSWHCDELSIPHPIRSQAKALFVFLYKNILSPCADRRKHYTHFCLQFQRRQTKDCPFCGLEDLFKVTDRLQDYDHILCKKHYPLAAVNPRNLIPMGMGCNQVFKADKPIAVDLAGNRRRAFYPYRDHALKITMTLEGSRRPISRNDPGTWSVRLLPDREEVRTWEDVYELPRRFTDYRIEDKYRGWFEAFFGFTKNPPPGGVWTEVTARQAILEHAVQWDSDPSFDQRLIRSALFRFLGDQQDAHFFQNVANRLNQRRVQVGLV